MQTCDVFCKIVDNYGDIGVCWRLSKQLAHEHGMQVRLFIDDFATASEIIPTLSPEPNAQTIDQITVAPWPQTLNKLPDLIIENFSCGVPEAIAQQVANLQASGKNIRWINLEYLSAEDWVEGYHLIPSEHPTLGFKKTFYYPGFSTKTGGLIREKGLFDQINHWKAKPEKDHFWQSLGLDPLTINQSIKLSLFCYPQANTIGLIKALAAHQRAITLFIPGHANSALALTLDQLFNFDPSGLSQHGKLTLQKLPFLSQNQYDQLLASCDLNFVRGEDSWIRALWSGQPFIWQPYIQAEDTHLIKLKAFLTRYLQATNTTDDVKALIKQAHLFWSNALPAEHTATWDTFLDHCDQWQSASHTASLYYHHQPSLTDQLENWLANTL